MILFDESHFRSTVAGNPFSQPFDLHVEPSNLLVQFGLDGLSLLALAAPAIAEDGLDAVEELLLPLTDLDGVDLVRLRGLGDGLGLLGGLQGDLGLEGGQMSLASTGHDAPRDEARTSISITSRAVQFQGSTSPGTLSPDLPND